MYMQAFETQVNLELIMRDGYSVRGSETQSLDVGRVLIWLFPAEDKSQTLAGEWKAF